MIGTTNIFFKIDCQDFFKIIFIVYCLLLKRQKMIEEYSLRSDYLPCIEITEQNLSCISVCNRSPPLSIIPIGHLYKSGT